MNEPTQRPQINLVGRSINLYEPILARLIELGHSETDALIDVAERYLDNKPATQGKRKISARERDRQFWGLNAWRVCPVDVWTREPLKLAIARYFSQEAVAAPDLVRRWAKEVPEVVCWAVRRSGLVKVPTSPRRTELENASSVSSGIAELCRLLQIFEDALRFRESQLLACKALLEELSVVEVLLFAGLYAFKHLVPQAGAANENGEVVPDETVWTAIEDLVRWKLAASEPGHLHLSETELAIRVGRWCRPIVFRDSDEAAAMNVLQQFEALVDAQVELNEFLARSADAFSYDDAVRFVRQGDRLEINEINPHVRNAWNRNSVRLARLHGYWMWRAIDAFAESAYAGKIIGQSDNHDANQWAVIRAMQVEIELREIYGIEGEVKTDAGQHVGVFQSALVLSLMAAFFKRDCIDRYRNYHQALGDWRAALAKLVLDGLVDGMQNRMPLTWSVRRNKIARIVGWTVTSHQPAGSANAASAILDFWTYDMAAEADRVKNHLDVISPRVHERPVFRFGHLYVQMPSVVGLLNPSTAFINNLRRIGSTRREARIETARIEHNLARVMREHGFAVLLNWSPPDPWRDAGEIDIIAARDGHLFVLEIKSTFFRSTPKEAWIHESVTVRKAGIQIDRKMRAVLECLSHNQGLRDQLGLTAATRPEQSHGWIVDTSIECDHQRFSGHLKFSLAELLIALRDDAGLLVDPTGDALAIEGEDSLALSYARTHATLYPNGFSARRFAEVIESEAVWNWPAQKHTSSGPDTPFGHRNPVAYPNQP